MQISDLFQQPEQHGTEPVFAKLFFRFRRTGWKLLFLLHHLPPILYLYPKAALFAQLFQNQNSPLLCTCRQLCRVVEKGKLPHRQEDFADTFDFVFQRVSGKCHRKREETLRHPTEEIAKYASVIDQKDFRKEIILDFLKEKNCDPKTLNVIVGRGGLLKPIPGGTYAVSDALLADLKAGVQGQHASNLGGILAREIGDALGVPSYIVDPVVVDELTDKARISGMPELPRRSIFHALNQKAVARRFAKENGKRYEELNLIVIHMGGGVSVGAHDHGKVVDVNNILDGEGCFSPERSGTVPVGDLVKMCFSGKYTQQEVYKKICGNGGFNGYLHTNDAREVGKMAESGDALAKQVWDAFFYQIAKDAGAMAAVLHGKVDQIILTGGIAYNPFTAQTLTDYLGWIAPVTTYPGEDELLALCQGALRVMTGEEEAKNY